MSVSTIIRIYCPKYHINLIYENNKNCRKSILPYPISFEILNIYKIVQFWCYETFSPLWFEPGSGHMWESQVLLTDGQVVFLRVLRFSPTFDERSARYKWNILERAVKPKSKKKKKKKMLRDTCDLPDRWTLSLKRDRGQFLFIWFNWPKKDTHVPFWNK